MSILINNQQNYIRLNRAKIRKTALKILSLLEHPTAELSILFVGDKKMKQLNTTFRGVHKTTDVLSFPQIEFGVRSSESRGRNKTQNSKLLTFNYILGDIVISTQKAASQARTSGKGLYDEIYRLLVHGILHLLGYDHEKTRHSAEAMRKKEQEILNAIKKMD